MINPVATIALAAAGIYLLNKATKTAVVNRVNFLIDGIQVTFQGLTPVLLITIKVQNPTNDSFKVKSLTGSVHVNGDYAGNISSFQESIIAANSESRLQLTLRLNPGQLTDQIVKLIQGNTPGQVLLRISGTANVDTLLFPVNLTYKIV